jgi:hypothetical protein
MAALGRQTGVLDAINVDGCAPKPAIREVVLVKIDHILGVTVRQMPKAVHARCSVAFQIRADEKLHFSPRPGYGAQRVCIPF